MNETDKLTAMVSERNQLRLRLDEMEAAIKAETVRIMSEKHGVRIGSIVAAKGKKYRVTRIDPAWGLKRPWLRGSAELKDGTFGAASYPIHADWTVITP